ncbi:YdcF family protein [Xylanimonas allomyrinae]|uniref:YdcF family protein n=1 Tax=Xylanimonas allomyrinae TaxID=2509459 RepID=A0A4V0YEK1_9MICO|nr:YdcF family protein [Xylanimonas allomyrinae]QAY64491.1 YdcF family protein [Xylanimonas allomyrinae]
MRPVRRRLLYVGGGLLALLLAAPVAWVQAVGQAHHRQVAEVGPVDAVVVLGAGLRADGTPSPYLRRRLALAATLHERGVASTVILSGDAHQRPDGSTYDEPASMRDWIVDHGVPATDLVLDREGFSTTATCRRAHDVYGARSAVVVTQDYHVRRALFSCTQAGLDAVGVGVSAASASPANWLWWHVREMPASWKAAVRELVGV